MRNTGTAAPIAPFAGNLLFRGVGKQQDREFLIANCFFISNKRVGFGRVRVPWPNEEMLGSRNRGRCHFSSNSCGVKQVCYK